MKEINDFDKAVMGFVVAGLVYIINRSIPLTIKLISASLALPAFLLIATFTSCVFKWESSISNTVLRIISKIILYKKKKRLIVATLIILAAIIASLCIFHGCQSTDGKYDSEIAENTLIASINGNPVSLSLDNVMVNRSSATYTAIYVSSDKNYVVALEMSALLDIGNYKMDRLNNTFPSYVNIRYFDGISEYILSGINSMCSLDLTYCGQSRTRYQGHLRATLCPKDMTTNSQDSLLSLDSYKPILQSGDKESSYQMIMIIDDFDFSTLIETP